MTSTSEDPTGRQFRNAMGRFATGITIISTSTGDEVHGMTANGFMSVSLDPRLVLVSVANTSRTGAYLRQTGRFGVSILSRDHEVLSDYFAGRPSEPIEMNFVDVDGTPVLADSVAWVTARISETHPAGDHTLFLGEVLEYAEQPGEPLIFHSGAYRSLALEEDFSTRWSAPHAWF